MTTSVWVGLLVAVGVGITIGVQSAMINSTAQVLGVLQVAWLIQLSGTLVGTVVLGVVWARGGEAVPPANGVTALVLLAGTMGMLIVPGVAVALPRVGQVVAHVAILAGQMGIAVLVDTLGLTGEPIPLEPRRLLGLIVVVIGAWLLLPGR